MAVIDRQPVESLKDGCNMIALSLICNNTCESVLNTLQLILIDNFADLIFTYRNKGIESIRYESGSISNTV